MPTDVFYTGTDWESSSGPIISRMLTGGDVWPEGAGSETGGTNKDDLADGLHPVLAVGPKASRPHNIVGTVMTFEVLTDLLQMNIAPGHIVKQYVANVTHYSGANTPDAWDASLAIGEPVYVDDSQPLDSGVTLSRSPANDLGALNPLAGYLWYDQDEYVDYHIGGAHSVASWPKTNVGNAVVYTLVSVLIWPDAY
jgi:hypothetical protein